MSKPYALKDWATQRKESPLETKMRMLTPGTSPGSVQHPFPVVLREDYLSLVRGKGIFKRAEKVKPKPVPLAGITGIQRNVNMERLAQHLGNPDLIPEGTRATGHGGLIDRVVLVKVGGKTYCHDGHHRLTAAHLRGQREIMARLVDLDDG